ncbi:MAG: hypothetical protein ACK4R8_01765 [Thiobacillus sp.]
MKFKATLATLSTFALLGAGTATASGAQPGIASQPAGAQQQPVSPPQLAPGMPMVPMWGQLPAAGGYPYFLMIPQPVPAYPLPQMAPQPGWWPFVMVWMPVQAMQGVPVPPVADYGPVADTPVVVLPEPDPEPQPDAAVSRTTQLAAPPRQGEIPLEQAAEGSAPASAVVADADYGPVAPSPVVELPDFSAPPAAQTKKKPAVRKKPVNKAPAAALPAGKRICWNNGVVAPCH